MLLNGSKVLFSELKMLVWDLEYWLDTTEEAQN